MHTQIFEGIKKSLALITVFDITYLSKFEKKRIADRFINLFFQSIIHDIRTPLNTIMSMNETLMMFNEENLMLQSCCKLALFSCQFLLMMLD
jgi:K+-sensing histidine kinase KdpD